MQKLVISAIFADMFFLIFTFGAYAWVVKLVGSDKRVKDEFKFREGRWLSRMIIAMAVIMTGVLLSPSVMGDCIILTASVFIYVCSIVSSWNMLKYADDVDGSRYP